MRFDGQVAIVTGAGTGLGPELTRRFVAEGARVVVCGRRAELLEPLTSEDGVVAVRADVTDEADVARLVDAALDAFGAVDVLVNNAAAPGTDLHIWEQTLENWNATLAVDLTAAMLCSREVLRRSMLERRRGAIVSMSSGAAWNGLPRKSHYCTAKAGLRTLTKVIALEAGAYGVRANCVVPGMIDTELLRRWIERTAAEQDLPTEERVRQLTADTALGAISSPADVASAVLFLASDDARTITGQSLTVDAGAVMPG